MTTDCLFCNIIDRKIPATIVYEDEQVIAFNDIDPKAPIHVLIIPKKHIATLNDIQPDDNALLGYLFETAKKIASDLQIADAGYRVIMNCNANGGQAVYHIHLHLLGGKQLGWTPA